MQGFEASGTNLMGVAEYCITAYRDNPQQALAQSKQFAIDALVASQPFFVFFVVVVVGGGGVAPAYARMIIIHVCPYVRACVFHV